MNRLIDVRVLEKRNKLLVSLINKGMSASEFGRKMNLSRERVCQLYFKRTGKSVTQLKLERKLKQSFLPKAKCLWCGRRIYSERKFHNSLCHRAFWAEQQRRSWAKNRSHLRNKKTTEELTTELKKKWGII